MILTNKVIDSGLPGFFIIDNAIIDSRFRPCAHGTYHIDMHGKHFQTSFHYVEAEHKFVLLLSYNGKLLYRHSYIPIDNRDSYPRYLTWSASFAALFNYDIIDQHLTAIPKSVYIALLHTNIYDDPDNDFEDTRMLMFMSDTLIWFRDNLLKEISWLIHYYWLDLLRIDPMRYSCVSACPNC